MGTPYAPVSIPTNPTPVNDAWTAYLLALFAGLIYAMGAILGKKGLELGSGQLRTVILSNLILSLCFLPHLFIAPGWPDINELVIGACLGSIFLLAQTLLFRALQAGDASMVSPLMGIKSVLVAAFLLVFGLSTQPITSKTWVAALLAALAVALIGWPSKTRQTNWRGIGLAILSAASFSLLDSLVPHFSHQSNPIRMLFCIFGSLGLLTLLLLPWAEHPIFRRSLPCDRWAWASGSLIALQAVLMSMAVACYHIPTEVNVVYSTRGLWTVLLVAWVGTYLGLHEGNLTRSIKLRRVLGSLLLGIGILLIA